MPATPPNVFDLIVSLVTSEKFIAAFLGLVGGTIATFIAPWTKWHFKEKELKRESRKEKLHFWREELNKFNTLSDFYQTPLYNELVGYIPDKEMPELLNNNTIEVILHIGTTTQDSRVIARFNKVISDKEKEWGII